MCGCVRGNVLGIFLLLGLSGMVGVLKVADLLFYCACLVGCVLLFLRSVCLVFVLFMLFVFGVLLWWMFFGGLCVYI